MKHEKEIKPQILVIDDEKWLKLILKDELIKKGYEVVTASNYDEAIVAIEGNEFDTIFADIRLEGKTGIDFLEETKKRNINSPVIIITGDPSANSAANALRFGAFDYIIKPIQYEKLMHLASKAVQHKTLTDQMNKYRSNLEAVFRSVKDAIVGCVQTFTHFLIKLLTDSLLFVGTNCFLLQQKINFHMCTLKWYFIL